MSEEKTNAIAKEYLEHYKKVKYGMMPEWVWDMAIKALEQTPKTGHWYDKWGKDGCSVCNEGIDDAQTFDGRPFRYCPMCGARMIEPQGEEAE